MKAYNLRAALVGVSTGEVKTAEEDGAAFPRLASFNNGAIYVGRFLGRSPWERHPDADELLHVLDGEVQITLLNDGSPVEVTIPAGSIFVVPKGLWHRQIALPSVTLLAATPDLTETSFDDDPRR